MKRILALMLVAVSVACLQAAPERTVSSKAAGTSKVMPPVAYSAAVMKNGIADSTYAMVQVDPVAVLKDVQPTVLTKVITASTQVQLKVAHRAPVVSAWLICAASPSTAPLGPDNPALAAFVQNTPRPTWHMPADDNPKAIEVAKGTELT